MKKFLLTALLIGSFSASFAQTVQLSLLGHLDNTAGAAIIVNFQVVDQGAIVINATSITDPMGDYSLTLVDSMGLATQGSAVMSFTDCNGISQASTDSYSPGNFVVDFGTMDYCSNIINPGCVAGFTVEQEYVIDTLNGNTIVNPIPNSLIVTNTSTGNGLSYSWDLGDGNTAMGFTVSHTYATAGPFTLCLTVADSTGCSDTFCDSIGVNSLGLSIGKQSGFSINMTGIMGVSDIESDYVFNLYPNPAVGNVTMEIGALSETANISVLDVSGRVIYSDVVESSSMNQVITIDLTAIPTGMYQVSLETQQGVLNKRLLVK